MKKMWLKVVSMLTALTMLFAFTPAADIAAPSKVNASSMVDDITEDVINSYTKDLSKMIGNVPYIGTILESIFDICSSEFLSSIMGKEKSADPTKQIQKDITVIKNNLQDLTVEQKLEKNEGFNDAANLLYLKCKKALDNNLNIITENEIKVANKLNELRELSEAGYEDSSKEIKKKLDELNIAREITSKSINDMENDIYTENFADKVGYIELAIQGQSVGQEESPLMNYMNAKCVTLKFGKDAYDDARKYQENVMKIYTMAHSLQNRILKNRLYTFNSKIESNNEIIEKINNKVESETATDDEKKERKKLLIENGELKNKITKTENALESGKKNMKDTIAAYNSTLKEEEKLVNKYYLNKDNSITIKGVAQAKIQNGCLSSVGNDGQSSMLAKYAKGTTETEKFKSYVNAFCIMIGENIKDTETVRQFLESKGIKVPKDAKYLLVDKCKEDNTMSSDSGTDRKYLYAVKLDESVKTKKIDYEGAKRQTIIPEEIMYYTAYYSNYTNKRVYHKKQFIDNNELCYFIEKEKETVAATVKFLNIDKDRTENFEDISEAWNYIIDTQDKRNAACYPVITLYEDWVAKKSAGGTTSSFGEGVGFKNGAICPDGEEGSKMSSIVTIDLNGHKIDRNLTNGATTPSSSQDNAAVDDGSVIIAEKATLKLKSSKGTGLITGGNTTEQGGGICVRSWLEIEDCDVKGNYARGNGGGIYLSWHDKAFWSQPTGTFRNVNITNNYTSGQGGGVATETASGYTSDIAISGKVVIEDNGKYTSDSGTSQNDCFLRENSVTKNIFYIKDSLDSGTKIGVISNTTDKKLDFTDSTKKGDYSGYFFYNNSDYRIEHYKGSLWNSSKHYLRIRKN